VDRISLQELRVDTIVGVYEWERQRPQTIELNLEFAIPGERPGLSDRIADTIDYGAVVERIRTSLAATHFKLLERVCEHVASLLLDEFGTPWCRVSAAKIGLVRGVKRLAVTIERGQPHDS
jgi:dihydroneopterin aldolase